MRKLLAFLGALTLCAFTASAGASPADPRDGAEYLTLPEVQNTDAGKKIEVTEFFAYYCPHCNAFEPVLAAWVKKQGERIVFKRVHVGGSASVAPQQRLFNTLEAMGILDQYHDKVFAAMHGPQRLRLASDEQVFDWAAKAGIDRAKFIDVYRSFGVAAKVRRADAMMEAYKIDSWPTLAVDGHYLTSPYLAGQGSPGGLSEAQGHQSALMVLDYLVSKAKSERR